MLISLFDSQYSTLCRVGADEACCEDLRLRSGQRIFRLHLSDFPILLPALHSAVAIVIQHSNQGEGFTDKRETMRRNSRRNEG